MCGIWGVLSDFGTAPSESDAHAAITRLSHRGPDRSGTFREENFLCAHTRLSIIDLSEASNQPYVTSRCALVFNGEIYNFRQLREELEARGSVFHSNGDTEVIARGYEHWGSEVFSKLRGMFAVGLYDRATHELFLARDRYGIKPLYFVREAGALIFASEIKALSNTTELSVSASGLFDLMSFGFHFDNGCFYAGIECIAAGTVKRITFSKHGIQARTIGQQSTYAPPDRVRLTDVQQSIEDSVAAHLISDVPVALALSGGLDSSVLAAIAAKQPNQLTAITNTWLGMNDPEVEYASRLSHFLGLKHRVVRDFLPLNLDLVRSIAWHLEEPVPNVACFHSYALAAACKKENIKVVLLGEGSDELFAGYPWHKLAATCGASLRGEALFDAYSERRSQRNAVLPYLTDEGHVQMAARTDWQRQFFAQSLDTTVVSPLEGFLAFDRKTQLQTSQLHRVDRMFMAHSVEARVPYLYDPITAIAANLPERAKVSNSIWRRRLKMREDKISLAAAFKRQLPKFILQRAKFGPRGSANLADHLAQPLTAVFHAVTQAEEFSVARDKLASWISWETVRERPSPFKVKLILTLLILCVGQYCTVDQ